MRSRRTFVLAALTVALFAIGGCAHNEHTWAQPGPSAGPGGLIEQPIWATPGKPDYSPGKWAGKVASVR